MIFKKIQLRMAAGIALLGLAAAATASSRKTHFEDTFDQGISTAWKPVKFEGKTEYSVVREGSTNAYLEAKANRSASGLAIDRKIPLQPGLRMEWRWKINKAPQDGSETKMATFDHTARLFVAFKSLIGPPRTINYVWANELPVNEVFDHPNSGRAKFIVLESGNANAGRWLAVSRDVSADWKRLFGGEPPKEISGFGLMTDSDGVQEVLIGGYDDIRFVQE